MRIRDTDSLTRNTITPCEYIRARDVLLNEKAKVFDVYEKSCLWSALSRLTISSEKKSEKKDENRRYMRREFGYSTFKRSFQLPDTVNQEQIKASHDAGILNIQLPKKQEVVQKAPKTIEVK